jgi:hypothetical protein
MNQTPRYRCAQILLVSLALASCTRAQRIGKPPDPPAVSRLNGSANPGYRTLTAAQERQLYDAEQALIKQCMNRRGLSYWREPQHPMPEDRPFPYVLTDVAWADKHGYGEDIIAARERINLSDLNQIYFKSLPVERRRYALASFNGTTTDIQVRLPEGGVIARSSQGCMAEAEQDLYGSVREYYTMTVLDETLTTERQNDVLTDARWLGALPRWSTRMSREGFHYDSPAVLRNDLTRLRRRGGFRAERRLAHSEARCAVVTGLSRIASALDQAYRARIEAEHPEVIESLAALRSYGLKRAAQIGLG